MRHTVVKSFCALGICLFMMALIAPSAMCGGDSTGGLAVSQVGVRVGRLTHSFFTPGTGDTRYWITSYSAAIWGVVNISKGVSIQAELQYLRKGGGLARYTNDPGLSDAARLWVHDSAWTHYIQIPILARLQANAGSYGLYAVAGPYTALAVSSSYWYRKKYAYSCLFETGTMDIADNIRTFDLGIVIGGGIDLFWTNPRITMDTRVSWSLTNAFDPPFSLADGGYAKNVTFYSVSLGLWINP